MATTDSFTPVMRALVVATLLLATATLMLVAVNTARAASALAIGSCGAHGWGKAPKLGRSQNEALRSCYEDGGKECVTRTFFCDAKG